MADSSAVSAGHAAAEGEPRTPVPAPHLEPVEVGPLRAGPMHAGTGLLFFLA